MILSCCQLTFKTGGHGANFLSVKEIGSCKVKNGKAQGFSGKHCLVSMGLVGRICLKILSSTLNSGEQEHMVSTMCSGNQAHINFRSLSHLASPHHAFGLPQTSVSFLGAFKTTWLTFQHQLPNFSYFFHSIQFEPDEP